MKEEKSCGGIVIHNNKVLLVKQKTGLYGFPKGHMETYETEEETAIREIKEETNIDAIIDSSSRYEVSYIMKDNILKKVVYFKATTNNPNNLIKQESELLDVEWVDEELVYDKLAFDDVKKIWREIYESN